MASVKNLGSSKVSRHYIYYVSIASKNSDRKVRWLQLIRNMIFLCFVFINHDCTISTNLNDLQCPYVNRYVEKDREKIRKVRHTLRFMIMKTPFPLVTREVAVIYTHLTKKF